MSAAPPKWHTPEVAAVLPELTAADRRPGQAMHQLLRELYPICRSITGEGVRETLRLLARHLPPGLEVHEVPSGTAVLDWTVPPEWNIRDAYVKDQHGRRVVDFQRHSLHVVSYSVPVPRQWMTRPELDAHLHSLPAQPALIPYRTSYYQPTWGFCLPHQLREQLHDEHYEVCIDSELNPAGSLTYGQLVLPGATDEEVLLSCHICHPSLANDNLAGVVTAAWLAQWLAARPHRRYTYRFVFVPGTIGSISWLHEHRGVLPRIRHGLVLSLLGGPGEFTYKRSRQGAAPVDRVVAAVLREAAPGAHQLRDFSPYGYDERQYCSPGFNLPVGCLTRTPFAEFPEYHTSADNPGLVRPRQLAASLRLLRRICRALEQHDRRYQNQQPYGEPQLGRRGLYGALKGTGNPKEAEMALLWVLNLADGQHDVLTMAERSGLSFAAIRRAVRSLRQADLLAVV